MSSQVWTSRGVMPADSQSPVIVMNRILHQDFRPQRSRTAGAYKAHEPQTAEVTRTVRVKAWFVRSWNSPALRSSGSHRERRSDRSDIFESSASTLRVARFCNVSAAHIPFQSAAMCRFEERSMGKKAAFVVLSVLSCSAQALLPGGQRYGSIRLFCPRWR